MEKLFITVISHLQTHYHCKLNFQKVDQHTGGKRSIHGIQHHRENPPPPAPALEYPSVPFY